ncbi:hypothetical protein [Aurantiacibacter zhengii]|uniref:hypothetical protein n=1 Tax=Aurantiacibacter zhengii TaxID=2307003 RepID=UPI0026CE9213
MWFIAHFLAQQAAQPPVAEPTTLAGQFTDALMGLRIVRTMTDVAHHSPTYAQDHAGPAPAHLENLLEMSHRLPLGSVR